MSEIDEHITSLIIAQLNHSASENELDELQHWLEADTKHAELYTEIKRSYYSRTINSSDKDVSNVFQKVGTKIEQQESQQKVIQLDKKPTINYFKLAGIAASILIILLLTWTVQRNSISETQAQLIEKVCPKGKKIHFFLPDGTEVWLNANSQFSYPDKFDSETRTVTLKGEAFFKVSRNEQQPFIVETSISKIKVLGTSFNINARTEDVFHETTVISGKVQVNSIIKSNYLTLVKNESARVNSDGKLSKSSIENIESVIAWKDNNLFYDNTPLSKVFKDLEIWYDIIITAEDPNILDKQLRAKFENPSLNELMDYISTTTNLEYTINGNKVAVKIRE